MLGELLGFAIPKELDYKEQCGKATISTKEMETLSTLIEQ